LLRRIQIAPERRDAILGEDRREHAVARTRLRVQHAVRVHDEPADVRLLQDVFNAVHVSAFRQPDAARLAARNIRGNDRAP